MGVRRWSPPDGMDRIARLWLFRTAGRHLWRVYGWYSLADLIQDGYVQYARVVSKYPAATERAHRMRLFQRCYHNWLNDLSNRRTKHPQELNESVLSREPDEPVEFGSEEPEAEFLATLPSHDRTLIVHLLTDEGQRIMQEPYTCRPDGTRETRRERFARLTGLPASTPFIEPPQPIRRQPCQSHKPPPEQIRSRLMQLGCTPEQVARHMSHVERHVEHE